MLILHPLYYVVPVENEAEPRIAIFMTVKVCTMKSVIPIGQTKSLSYLNLHYKFRHTTFFFIRLIGIQICIQHIDTVIYINSVSDRS